MIDEIIYFELDNWFAGEDYPNEQPFLDWMGDDNLFRTFLDNDWCVKNCLCVQATLIDMSVCICVSATREWVEKNCPKLLTNEECGNTIVMSHYNDFICQPDENGEVYGRISGIHFAEYKEENFGIQWINEGEE